PWGDSVSDLLHGVLPWAMEQSVCPAPVDCYRPLHQPSAVLWLYQERPSLWFSFICTPCLLHQPSAAGTCMSVGFTTRGKRWSIASSRCSNRPSSLSRKVSCTWRPASSRWTFTLAGASGSGAAGVGGCAGWLAGVAWPVLAASHLALASG